MLFSECSVLRWCQIAETLDWQPQHDADCSDRKGAGHVYGEKLAESTQPYTALLSCMLLCCKHLIYLSHLLKPVFVCHCPFFPPQSETEPEREAFSTRGWSESILWVWDSNPARQTQPERSAAGYREGQPGPHKEVCIIHVHTVCTFIKTNAQIQVKSHRALLFLRILNLRFVYLQMQTAGESSGWGQLSHSRTGGNQQHTGGKTGNLPPNLFLFL